MEKKALVLVDDHVIVRNGLKALIEKLGPYEVVAEFDSAIAFSHALPIEPSPDLILMDLNMPGMNGDELIEKLRKANFSIPILVLTLNSDESTIIRLFRNGVKGLLMKNCSASILKTAIETILEGGYYHNEFLTLSLTKDAIKPNQTEQEVILASLTDREKEFLKLVCNENELTYEQIADRMDVARRTVDGYREGIFEKWNIKSKTGLVLFVLKHNLLGYL